MATPTSPFVGNAWDQQPEETAKAYAAFVVYRDLGPDRSLQQAARICTKNESVLRVWSAKYTWGVRVIAWQMALQRAEDTKRQQARLQMVDRHGQAATTLLALALRGMAPRPIYDAEGQVVLQQNPATGRMEPVYHAPTLPDLRAAAVALDKAIYHQRLAAGLPTDHTRQDVYLREEVRRAQEVNETILRVLEEHLCDECRVPILDSLRHLHREAGEPAAESRP